MIVNVKWRVRVLHSGHYGWCNVLLDVMENQDFNSEPHLTLVISFLNAAGDLKFLFVSCVQFSPLSYKSLTSRSVYTLKFSLTGLSKISCVPSFSFNTKLSLVNNLTINKMTKTCPRYYIARILLLLFLFSDLETL